MGPLADDFPPVHHNNLVGIADRVQVVGDRDDGLVPARLLQSLLDERFVFGVDGGRRLIQDQDGGVLQDCPGQGDALSLPPGELDAASPMGVA